jgi:hypothetical protein
VNDPRNHVHAAVPPALAAAISRDLAPVRPLLSAAKRSLVVGAAATAAGAALVTAHGVAAIDSPATAVASIAMRLALGTGLCFVALREGVPSDGVSIRTRWTAAALAAAGLLLLPLLQSQSGAAFSAHVSHCYWLVLLTATPVVALVAFLLGRAYPIRAVSAMALGSFGAAYLADIAASLICADRNLEHAFVFHGGAVLTLAVVGTFAGSLLRRMQRS